jgi:hypothetical protein
MKTPQQYFNLGAEAMKTEIAVRLTMAGHIEMAPKILEMPLPKFQEPERFEITKDKEK